MLGVIKHLGILKYKIFQIIYLSFHALPLIICLNMQQKIRNFYQKIKENNDS